VQDVRELCRIEGVYSRWMTLSLPVQKADWHLSSIPPELQAMSGKAMLWEGLIRWAARQLLLHVNVSNSVGFVFSSWPRSMQGSRSCRWGCHSATAWRLVPSLLLALDLASDAAYFLDI
jgi:hypothetical protein